MTQEKLDRANGLRNDIGILSSLCNSSVVKIDNRYSYYYIGEAEVQAIIDEANEKVREKARIALAKAKAEFEAL